MQEVKFIAYKLTSSNSNLWAIAQIKLAEERRWEHSNHRNHQFGSSRLFQSFLFAFQSLENSKKLLKSGKHTAQNCHSIQAGGLAINWTSLYVPSCYDNETICSAVLAQTQHAPTQMQIQRLANYHSCESKRNRYSRDWAFITLLWHLFTKMTLSSLI